MPWTIKSARARVTWYATWYAKPKVWIVKPVISSKMLNLYKCMYNTLRAHAQVNQKQIQIIKFNMYKYMSQKSYQIKEEIRLNLKVLMQWRKWVEPIRL